MHISRHPIDPPTPEYIQAFALYVGRKPSDATAPTCMACRLPNGLWEVLERVDCGGGIALQRMPGTYLSASFVAARQRFRDRITAGGSAANANGN